jgi:hypothetical protein
MTLPSMFVNHVHPILFEIMLRKIYAEASNELPGCRMTGLPDSCS